MQVPFLSGSIWHLPDGPEQISRDNAMASKLKGKYHVHSSNLYHNPQTVPVVYGYDAEDIVERALAKYLGCGREPCHADTGVTKALEDRYLNWFIPPKCRRDEKCGVLSG